MFTESDILDDEFLDLEFETSSNEVETKSDTNRDTLDNDFFAELEASLNEKELVIIANRPDSDFKVLTYKKVDYYIPRIVNSFPIPVYDHLKQVGVICQNDINNIQFNVNEN